MSIHAYLALAQFQICLLIVLGHNTTGEYIQTTGKVNYNYEKVPKMIVHYIDKNKDHITPVEGVDIRDVACGTNHTVSNACDE